MYIYIYIYIYIYGYIYIWILLLDLQHPKSSVPPVGHLRMAANGRDVQRRQVTATLVPTPRLRWMEATELSVSPVMAMEASSDWDFQCLHCWLLNIRRSNIYIYKLYIYIVCLFLVAMGEAHSLCFPCDIQCFGVLCPLQGDNWWTNVTYDMIYLWSYSSTGSKNHGKWHETQFFFGTSGKS